VSATYFHSNDTAHFSKVRPNIHRP